jgi:hypothetical protein
LDVHRDIRVAPALANLIPPLAAGELAGLDRSLRDEGCRDPLVVWKWRGKRVLLDGHNRLRICRRYGIPFRIVELELIDLAAARAWVIDNQLRTRRNLSTGASSYLRGRAYLQLRHQGRTDSASGNSYPKRTSEQLAAEYKVSEKTIRLDAAFTRAVDAIADNCSAEVRQRILGRDGGLRRTTVLWLARLSPPEQRQSIAEWLRTGKLPRRKQPEGATITLPVEEQALVHRLIQRRGCERAGKVLRLLAAALGLALPADNGDSARPTQEAETT